MPTPRAITARGRPSTLSRTTPASFAAASAVRTCAPALASATVLDENGAPHPLADAWREKTAVIAWVRQFG